MRIRHPQRMVAPLGGQPHRILQRLGLFGGGLEGATEREGLHKRSMAYHAKEVSGYRRHSAAWGHPSLTEPRFGGGFSPQTPRR